MANRNLKQKIRVQIDFSEEAYAALCDIQRMSGYSTKAETIRCALGTLKWAAEEIRAGNRIFVEKNTEDGKKKMAEVIFHFIKAQP
mgnify:CR=1 FL=1